MNSSKGEYAVDSQVRAHSAALFALGVLVVAGILVLALVSSASAVQRVPAAPPTFGAAGALGGQLNAARGIAVNETGAGGVAPNTVYVAEFNNLRISSFILDDQGTPEDTADDTYDFLRAWGQNVVNSGGGNGAEFQRVTVDAASGTFTLSFGTSPADDPVTTDPIDHDATAEEVRDALGALGSIAPAPGAIDVRVFGPAGGPWSVRFLGNSNRALLGSDGTNLSGDNPAIPGAGPTIAATEIFPGGAPSGFEVCEATDVCKVGVNGSGAGHFNTAGLAGGIAVDQSTGNVVVIDRNNVRVQQFSATGEFLRTWGKDVATTGGDEFEICEVPANCRIGKNNGEEAGMFGSFGVLITDLATDDVGNVYVLDSGRSRIQKFGPDGTFQRMAGWNVIANGSPSDPGNVGTYEVCTAAMGADCQSGTAGTGSDQFGSNAPSFVTASPAGDVYVVGRNDGMIYRLNSNLGFVQSYPATAGSGTSNPNRNALAFDRDDGRVYFGVKDPIAAGPANNIYELNPNSGVVAASATAAGADWVGLAINGETGRMYGTQGTSASVVNVFDALPSPPVLTIAAATGNTGTRATLHGTVNPKRLEVGQCFFEWGTSPDALTGEAQCVPSAAALGDGNVATPVEADITGLVPNGTTYHYRLKAVNSAGTNQTVTSSFTTPTTVVTGQATPLPSGTAATLSGTVNPDGVEVTECVFEWGATTNADHQPQYEQAPVPCTQAPGSLTGTAPLPVDAELTGLDPATVYHFRLRITYAEGIGPVVGKNDFGGEESFQTLGPRIAATFAEDVTLNEATLVALIDPEGADTGYRFQYGTAGPCSANPCTDVPVPDGAVGEGIHARRVEQRLEGLNPNATYHFRVIATDANLVVSEGPDLSFETAQPAPDPGCANEVFRVGPAAELPECRAYEWVSDGDSWGGGLFSLNAVNSSGDRIWFRAKAFDDTPSTPLIYQPFISHGGEGRWSVGAPIPGETAIGVGFDAPTVSDDVSAALWPGLIRERSLRGEMEWTIARSDGSTITAFPLIEPLLRAGETPRRFTRQVRSAATDFSTFVWDNNTEGSTQTYLPDEPLTVGSNLSHLYVIEDAGTPDARFGLVNRATNPAPGVPGAVIGGVCGTNVLLGAAGRDLVSDDGESIYFVARPGATGSNHLACTSQETGNRLYKRVGGEETIEVSVPTCSRVAPPCDSEGNVPDVYEGASDDGEVVFFRSARQLTDSDTDSTSDLYVYDADPPKNEPKLAQASVGEFVAGDHPVPGAGAEILTVAGVGRNEGKAGVSGDGSRAYFLARGRLTPEAVKVTGASQQANLYVYERSEKHPKGRVEFIGTFATQFEASVASFPEKGDGRYLFIRTAANLLPEDPDALADLYRYDDETGELLCASCAGDEPAPGDRFAVSQFPISGQLASDDGSAAIFTTREARDADHDLNGAADVYVWREGGSLELATPGVGEQGVFSEFNSVVEVNSLAMISPNGASIAFMTLAKLDPADTNSAADAYVARIGGGYPPLPEPVICASGEECQGAPSDSPAAGSPASPGFSGPGNPASSKPKPKKCKQGQVRKKGKCVKKKVRAKRKQAKRRRAGRNGGAGR